MGSRCYSNKGAKTATNDKEKLNLHHLIREFWQSFADTSSSVMYAPDYGAAEGSGYR